MVDARRSIGAWWLAALVAILGAGTVLAGCSTGESQPALPPSYSRTIDLSYVIREDVPHLPAEPQTRLERDDGGRVAELRIGTLTGSLLAVTATQNAEVKAVDQLSPRDLVVPAVVIDMRDEAQDRPEYALSVDEILSWEQVHGSIPAGALVLLVTGWDIRWGDAAAYLNLNSTGQPQVPGFDPAAARLLLNERRVAGLGLDAPGKVFLPADGYRLLLENLTNLEQLPPTGTTVVIGALKLQAAQSSPARVLALVP